ncbi:hypothetical protein [Desulfovibrio fairfieldensis]|uniref:Uncharacterized protein n=1 Tax=Desulfovibrio fairfieldensis TaxID=44742 RepID=A0A0X8JJE3_9BACT|nr:hypothetical protein [Desulfovibrio fairfieldensis]AMD89473.1 hypothetical protein AXF13_04740 [Desulfovibrio fairfieldensis]
MKVILKSCPHCQQEGQNLQIETNGGGITYICCLACFLRGPVEVNVVQAVQAWNELPRAPQSGKSIAAAAEPYVLALGDVYIQGCLDGYNKGVRKVNSDLRLLALAAQSQNLSDLARALNGVADGNDAALPVTLRIFQDEMKRHCASSPPEGINSVVDGGNVVQ